MIRQMTAMMMIAVFVSAKVLAKKNYYLQPENIMVRVDSLTWDLQQHVDAACFNYCFSACLASFQSLSISSSDKSLTSRDVALA